MTIKFQELDYSNMKHTATIFQEDCIDPLVLKSLELQGFTQEKHETNCYILVKKLKNDFTAVVSINNQSRNEFEIEIWKGEAIWLPLFRGIVETSAELSILFKLINKQRLGLTEIRLDNQYEEQ